MRSSGRKSNLRLRPARGHERQGFTLIEVIAGTVLLGTLVAGIIVSTSAHQRKIRTARLRIEAAALADDLLNDWQQQTEGIPLSGTGLLTADGRLHWQTRVVANRVLCGVPVHVVRLHLLHAQDPTDLKSLVSVDLVARQKLRRVP